MSYKNHLYIFKNLIQFCEISHKNPVLAKSNVIEAL